jgi:hypothetical protein
MAAQVRHLSAGLFASHHSLTCSGSASLSLKSTEKRSTHSTIGTKKPCIRAKRSPYQQPKPKGTNLLS